MLDWSPPPLAGRLVVVGHPVLVGRHRELEKLEAAWESVLGGTRQAVFIGGEPGAGKSRIVAEAAHATHRHGAAVLLGTGHADFGAPYREFVEALSHLFKTAPQGSLAPLLPDSASELLRLAPEVRRHRTDLAEPTPAQQEYRRELFDAVVELIHRLCAVHPLVLVLEDFHWSQTPARLLLSHLIQNTADDRLLLLVTYRTTAPDRSEELTHVIADLYRLPGTSRIDLVGLDTEAIEEYLIAESGLTPLEARGSAPVLRDQTGGNAFLLRELWRDLADRGGVGALQAAQFRSTPSIRDTLDRRLRHMTQPQREVIDLAAIVGSPFDLPVLLAACQHDQATTLEAVDEALQYGLIGRIPDDDRYDFLHALVRQAVVDRMPHATRMAHHAAVALVLEDQALGDATLAPELAFHFGEAAPLGYTKQAANYAVAAARHAERSFAHEQAASWFEEAAGRTGHDRPQQSDLLVSAAESHLRAGDFAEARRIYEDLVSASDPDVRLRGAAGFENASWRPGRAGHRALELLDRALSSVQPDPTNPHYVRALARQGRAFAFAGDDVTSRRIGTVALEMARELRDEVLIADVLEASLPQGITPGLLATNYQRALELTELAESLGEYGYLGPASTTRRLISYMGGKPKDWHEAHRDVNRTSRRTGEPFWKWLAECGDYVRAFISGRFAEAAQLADQMLELGESFGSDGTEGPHGIQMFMVQRETGAIKNVRHLVSGEETLDGVWAPGLLALYTELGMSVPARRVLAAIMDRLDPNHGQTAEWPAVLAFLSEAAVFLGDRDAGARIRDLVAEYAGYNLMVGHSVVVFGSANRYLGMLDALLGSPDAEEHYERSLLMDRSVGSVIHEAETLARYARWLESADPDRAQECGSRARRLAEAHGQQRVLAMLASADVASHAPTTLTPREHDVLRLLAEGLSNKEIGDRLFISQNTAANHVRSILTKTGTTNRTQAAILAADEGLLS